jgi:hypothetical protein
MSETETPLVKAVEGAIAWVDEKVTKAVQGVGLYLEYEAVTSRSTAQYIFFPEGYTETKQRVSPVVFYRYLTQYSSRSMWRARRIQLADINFGDPETLARELSDVLLRPSLGEYSLVGKPLLFEVSQKDLVSVKSAKLPSRINLKIQKMRGSHGFPESLIRERVEA